MDVYEALREMLDKHPSGCPPAPEIDEILRLLFTEEEARVALGLGFRPFPLETVARRAGVEPVEAERRLEALADKGMVFAKKKDGGTVYALLATMPGIFEFPFMKGERRPVLDRLAELWSAYHGRLAACFGAPSTAIARILPVEEEIPDEQTALPYEKVYKMIEEAEVMGVAHCACRESERRCDAPREACMLFGDACVYLVERGFARYVDREEMKRLLKEADAAGLVHQTNNSQGKIEFVCNCCPCCCVLLRARYVHGNPHVLAPSAFLPEVDPDACAGCGVCADERCPVEALVMEEERPRLVEERCLGCGLCVTGCPEGAMKLVRRAGARPPPRKTSEMGMKILMEKGKLQEFLPYVTPDAPVRGGGK